MLVKATISKVFECFHPTVDQPDVTWKSPSLSQSFSNGSPTNTSMSSSSSASLHKSSHTSNDHPVNALDNLLFMERVKGKLETIQKSWSVSRSSGGGHFVFTGEPGTGKTAAARAIANVLFGLGLLTHNKIVEKTAMELTGENVGDTKVNIQAALRRAQGGVLLIDEAHVLGLGPYGREACETITAATTNSDYNDVVMVMVGYPYEMDAMLKASPLLRKCFTHLFQFPDWTPDECVLFFDSCARREKFSLGVRVLAQVSKACCAFSHLDEWKNGTDVKKLWLLAKRQWGDRVIYAEEVMDKVIQLPDLNRAIAAMMNEKLNL